MKIPSRVDGSVCGAVLSNRPSQSALRQSTSTGRKPLHAAAAAAAAAAASGPVGASRGGRRGGGAAPGGGRDAGFFTSARLEKPSACPQSSLWLRSTFMPTARGIQHGQAAKIRRDYSTAAAEATPSKTAATRQRQTTSSSTLDVDRNLARAFVRGDSEGTVRDHLDFHQDPYLRRFAPANAPAIQISDRRHDVQYPPSEDVARGDDETQRLVHKLQVAISLRMRHPSRHPLQPIYDLYMQLPETRMLHLEWYWRARLLKIMGLPGKRNMATMLRYFSLVTDVKSAGIALQRTHWNYALAFAAKYVARTTSREMESALRLWREMERQANVKGNDVTFNILFDVASKAGNFQLADMIYQEMDHRGIAYTRYHYVSLIHYFGLKLDSGGIRAAYKEMVDAGEMVDTLVLNCVIGGLLRCGEEPEAEETYERMKMSHTNAAELPAKDYMMNKVVTRVLMMFSKLSRAHPQLKESLQTQTHLTPDLRTYKIIVQHYAVKAGNLKKVAQYLDEMKHLQIALEPTIFLPLLKGFYLHGGYEGSDWSEQRLDGVLSAMYKARDDQTTTTTTTTMTTTTTTRPSFRIDRWLVIWALRAVQKCSATPGAVEDTLAELVRRWDVDEDRLADMRAICEGIVEGRDMTSAQGTWEGPMYNRRKKYGCQV